MLKAGPIGVFDSGFGGLTVFKEITAQLPGYDYVYLGDNARAPYGNRSFETVYEYTLQCVKQLFEMNCRLVILACNTASAKALRTIQQNDLSKIEGLHRVLGVIRPTTEIIGNYSKTGVVGLFATSGTVLSDSYPIELAKFFPKIKLVQEACPMWVPLVENGEHESEGADYFIKKHIDSLLKKAPTMDVVVLACTHYPLLIKKIKKYLPEHIQVIAQGGIVAHGTVDYLKRHPEIEVLCSKGGSRQFFTTDLADDFGAKAKLFLGEEVSARQIHL